MANKRTVLLALAEAHYSFFKGAARYAQEHNWHLVTDMMYTARIPCGWRGNGIISFIGYRNDLAEFILSAHVPTVEISMVRNDINLPRVEGDNEMIGRLAAEHFLERGHRNFVWAPLKEDIVNAERHCGFADSLGRENRRCHVLPIGETNRAGGGASDWSMRRRVLIKELSLLNKPLAVFAYNDCLAADILDACDDAGLLVPENAAILGVDNDNILCECLRVPLSSVCHDLESMAYQAAILLDQLMAGEQAPKEVIRVRPKGIVTRRSTDIWALDNQLILEALRFIHAHYSNPLLGVDDVVAATGISRRPLENAFRAELRRGIHEEIARVRLEHVKRLLTSTARTVAEISAETGFTRVNHLFRVFREQVGMSPNKYRVMQDMPLTRYRPSHTGSGYPRKSHSPLRMTPRRI